MSFIDKLGSFFSIIFPLFLFLSYKGSQSIFYFLLLLFLISVILSKNKFYFTNILDNKLYTSLLLLIFLNFLIAFFSGGLFSRIDITHYLYLLLFFPLTYFLNETKKIFNFLICFLIGGSASLIISLGIFIKNFKNWQENPQLRIFFEIHIQDFSNILSIFLLFLISLFIFYRNENKKKNIIIKLGLFFIFSLDLFIILISRSKMVYICLIPAMLYILFKKNRKYIILFLPSCFVFYFFLPSSIKYRLEAMLANEDPSTKLRIIFWENAIASIKKSPILGMNSTERIQFALNYYKNNNTLGYIEKWYGTQGNNLTGTHNMYLHHFVNYGISGIWLLYFLFILIPSKLASITFFKLNPCSFWGAFEIGIKASYIAYLIQSGTENNFSNKSIILFFAMFLFCINFLIKRGFVSYKYPTCHSIHKKGLSQND